MKKVLLILLLLISCNNEKKHNNNNASRNIKEKTNLTCIYDNSFISVAENPDIYFFNSFSPNSWEKIKKYIYDKKLPPPEIIDIQDLYNQFVENKPEFKEKLLVCPWNTKHYIAYISIKNEYDSVKVSLSGSSYIGYRIIGGNCKKPYKNTASLLEKEKNYLLVLELVPKNVKYVPGINNLKLLLGNQPPRLILMKGKEKKELKIWHKIQEPTPEDYKILFISGFVLRYRQVKFQEELKEGLLKKLLYSANFSHNIKKEIEKQLKLLFLIETENIGI